MSLFLMRNRPLLRLKRGLRGFYYFLIQADVEKRYRAFMTDIKSLFLTPV